MVLIKVGSALLGDISGCNSRIPIRSRGAVCYGPTRTCAAAAVFVAFPIASSAAQSRVDDRAQDDRVAPRTLSAMRLLARR